MRILVLAACALLPLTCPASAADWTRFRGPNGSGNVPEAEIPDTWAETDYAWQTELPGDGVGSPVVWGDRVFLVAASGDSAQRVLVCLDLESGEVRWQRPFSSTPHRLHPRNTYASSTPCCDAEHVYAAWSDPEHTWVVCFTHDGRQVWKQDLGTWQSQHGFGTSPMLAGGNVILFDEQQGADLDPDESPGQSEMVALDRLTGEFAWRTPLTTTRVCYGTPCVRERGGRTELIASNTGDGIFALDAETGEPLWNRKVFRARCVNSPILAGELVLASAGSGGGGNHLVAVRADADRGEAEEAYRIERRAPYVPTPVYDSGRVYIATDPGFLSCVDAETGKELWMQRLGGNFAASPLVLGDKLLCIDMEGTAHVLRAGGEYEPLGRVELGAPVQATPAYAGGRLLIRAGNRLLCLPAAKS